METAQRVEKLAELFSLNIQLGHQPFSAVAGFHFRTQDMAHMVRGLCHLPMKLNFWVDSESIDNHIFSVGRHCRPVRFAVSHVVDVKGTSVGLVHPHWIQHMNVEYQPWSGHGSQEG